MVHTFRALGRYFLTDTESGSVFEIDELTHCLVLRRLGQTQSENMLERYSAPEIAGADFELRELERQGLLFSQITNYKLQITNNVIKALCLNVCHACNLRCGYCFADGGTYGGSAAMMSAETACAAVDFLIERSGKRRNVEIDFFGGEPLLNFGAVKEAVIYARGKEKACGKKFRFTITTNGVSLDKEKIAFINKEFSNVVVSIDGRESVHNLIRKSADGRDTYKETVNNALALIKERKGDYFIRGTFTNKNLDFAKDVWELYGLGFKYISIEPVALPDSHPLAIRGEHLAEVCREYETLAESILSRGDNAPDFFHFRLDLRGAPCRDKLVKGCGAGGEYAAISPDGSIYPCHQFDGKEEYRMGSLRRGGGGIDKTPPAKRVPQYPILNRGECAECWAKYYCGGGCAANSVSFNKDAGKPYETACKLFKKRAESAIALYSIKQGKSLD